MPVAVSVFPGNGGGISRDVLLSGSTLGGAARRVVGRESLGKDAIDPIGPSAVMFDDLIRNFGHVSLLRVFGGSIMYRRECSAMQPSRHRLRAPGALRKLSNAQRRSAAVQHCI